MPREVNQGHRTIDEEPIRSALGLTLGEGERFVRPRWFAALDPAASAEVPRARGAMVAVPPLLGAALILLAVLEGALLRASIPLALVACAVFLVVRARRPAAGAGAATRRRHRGVELDRSGLVFRAERAGEGRHPGPRLGARHPGPRPGARPDHPGPRPGARPDHPGPRPGARPDVIQQLLDLDAPFGVTLLSTPRRDRLVALLSSAGGTFYLGAAFDAGSRRAFAPLLDRASTVVSDEAGLEAVGPDGEPLLFAPDELASLLDGLVEHSPSCLDRFVVTDARGAAITLDSRLLCVGDRAVDLTAPLEWKPIVFQEAFGQAVAVYQGTWVRQGGTELVLVCLLPSLGAPGGADLDMASLDRGVLRDLRLMQAAPEQPPPNDQRVAIERLFMLPLRSALDRAPRPSQQPSRARA